MSDPENLEPPEKPRASLPMRFEHSTGPNIPPDVWRNLSKEQLAQFLNEAMEFNREMERKRFQLEETEAARMDTAQTRRIVVGGLVVALGLAAIAYLAAINQPIVAVSLTTALA